MASGMREDSPYANDSDACSLTILAFHSQIPTFYFGPYLVALVDNFGPQRLRTELARTKDS
jgi:hypothetical protein